MLCMKCFVRNAEEYEEGRETIWGEQVFLFMVHIQDVTQTMKTGSIIWGPHCLAVLHCTTRLAASNDRKALVYLAFHSIERAL